MNNFMYSHYVDKNKKKQKSPPVKRIENENECQCQFCDKCRKKQLNKSKIIRQMRYERNYKKGNERLRIKSDLIYVLERLVIPKNKIVTRKAGIFVSEICYFENGSFKALYMNKSINDSTVIKVNGDKLNITLFTKIMNEKRNRYRHKIMKKNNILILQYVDGYQKLLNDKQFFNLMQKRKQDMFWKSVHSFKNFIILPKQKQIETIILYKHNQNINIQLFQRAQTVTLINSKNIVEDPYNQEAYISENDEQKYISRMIESNDLEILFTYLTYKTIKFIQKFYDELITKGEFRWVIDELKRPVLLDVQYLQMKELIKYDWTQQVFEQRKRMRENEIFEKKEILSMGIRQKQISDMIGSNIFQQYNLYKSTLGIKPILKQDVAQIQIRSNKIKSMMKQQRQRSRKPLCTSFNTSMIRLLNKLAPAKYKYYTPTSSPLKQNYTSKTISTSKHIYTHISTSISQQPLNFSQNERKKMKF